MPKIKNIERDLVIQANDKLLGSDTSGVTRNYLVSDLTDFIKASGLSFKHHQNNASNTWSINHNLDLNYMNKLDHVSEIEYNYYHQLWKFEECKNYHHN